jgi:Domain of unknown function (DUF4190)/Domain of unknown function (DUF1707)
MTAGSYGPMRATDADRDSVYTLLQAAYADGRLAWDEFDARSTAALAAKTYDQLAPLTADLRKPVVVPTPQPYQPIYRVGWRTNRLAVASLACGIGQLMFLFPASIAAVICGHLARGQIRRNGEQGSGAALAGLILGYIGLVLTILIAGVAVRTGHVAHR